MIPFGKGDIKREGKMTVESVLMVYKARSRKKPRGKRGQTWSHRSGTLCLLTLR